MSGLGHAHLKIQIRIQIAALCHIPNNICQYNDNLTVPAGVVQTGASVVVCRCSAVHPLLVRV